MKPDRRLLIAMLVPGLALAAWAALGAVVFRATLDEAARASFGAALSPVLATHGVLPLLWWLIGAALGAWAMRRLHERYIAAPLRLAEATRILAGDPASPEVAEQGSAPTRTLAEAVNALARQRRALHDDVARQVADASRRVEQERGRLAALMAELAQSVVVCNLDGRILLYNARARALFRSLSQAPPGAGGAELIGLGRSIHAVFDPALLAHALRTIERRMADADAAAADVSAQFVTSTAAGQLLHVQMAPVRTVADDTGRQGDDDGESRAGESHGGEGHGGEGHGGERRAESDRLDGYVLMLEDISAEYEEQSRRDRLLLALVESSRASLASMQAALDMLEYPDLDVGERDRFQRVVRDEVVAMSERLRSMVDANAEETSTRWPLQDMLGADLVSAAAQRISSARGKPIAAGEVDDSLWLRVDSFSLLQALSFLAERLEGELGVRSLQLRLSRAGNRAHLDLVWSGEPASNETVMGWQIAEMQIGDRHSPLSVRDVVERHGGEFWFERDRARQLAFLRFLLPLASEHAASRTDASVAGRTRPEFYDFDLFRVTDSSRALEDRALHELAYTVFDTETTGLDPSDGDEIIQIGATRIVNGKLLRGECFDQLVDPQRRIPAASIPIHGIRNEMVRGQPPITQVLPAFHAFARDTVLVAHNAAFDMRFLQLKEAASGVRFEQPVLDTLLLSAVVHPYQPSHRLEAIAERLGVPVQGRHSAIGDALATAEIFLKLLALLREQGIVTLGQAREAAQKSYFARITY